MRYLRIKNWEDFQHYKKRSPPWIKLYRDILTDYSFASLKDGTKAHLMLIWLLASSDGGRVPHDDKFIAHRIGATEKIDLDAIIAAGFLIAEGNSAEINPPAAEKEEKARFVAPSWLDKDKWDAWIKLRPAKARTAEAQLAAITKLAKMKEEGHDPNAIIETSLANGWQGIFEPKNGAKAALSGAAGKITCRKCGVLTSSHTNYLCDPCYRARA